MKKRTPATPAPGADRAAAPTATTPAGPVAAAATTERTAAAARPDAARVRPLPALLGTAVGRLLLVAAFTGLLAVAGQTAWQAVGLTLALLSVFPSARRPLVIVAALVAVAVAPPLDLVVLDELAAARGAGEWLGLWPVLVLATLAFGCGYPELVRRRPKSLVGRNPVLALVLLLTALLVAAAHAPLEGSVWLAVSGLAMTFGSYMWFFAYAAAESKFSGNPAAPLQVGYWRPFWGFSNVPIGKGAAYLERVEARDAEALARSQVAGLKLMAWAVVLVFAMEAFGRSLYAPHGPHDGLLWWLPAEGLPRLGLVLERQAAGDPFPLATRWASLLGEFVLSVLHMATWSHPIIATARMAGYRAAPNMDRPLLSTSVADFYNRFYFYFKEMLATFFFYPTYLTFFRRRPKLRLFAATVAAAGFGNFLFHFYRDSADILRLGYLDALVAYRAYALYALLLGVGIAVSQQRLQARRRREPKGVRRVAAIAGVLAFYCLLGPLDVRTPYGLDVYAGLYLGLLVP